MALVALSVVSLFIASAPLLGGASAQAAPAFKVLGLYSGTFDAAHISFVREANPWFTQLAAANNFSYTASNDWNQLNTANLAQYKAVMFLDDLPQSASQRSAFQQYMQNGGGFIGFHVSAFNTNPASWDWYHNQFLGTGSFQTNTWGPTTAILRVEDRTHPATTRLPATFTSAVSEWYSWQRDLRTNPNMRILASVDPSSFPLGTDPNQTWRSGYFPIVWTNRNYKMLYANFGHNAMNYQTNTPLSSTFASEIQNRLLLDGLLWMGGVTGNPSPTPTSSPPAPGPINPAAWYTVANKGNNKCVDARGAATANGTAIQQFACNSTNAQQYQFQPTSDGYVRINNRSNSAQVVDVSNVSAADNALLHLWAYGGGNNQQWQPVAEGGGAYHFVSRNSGKCLNVPGASTADSVQLVQFTCNGSAAQSFQLNQQP
jgi:type 1 glutamine amidotransferase